jgi:hypothetical protein
MGLNPQASVFQPGQPFVNLTKNDEAYDQRNSRTSFGNAFGDASMVLHATNAKLERLRRDGGVVVTKVEAPLPQVHFEPDAPTNEHEELDFEEMFHHDEEAENVQTPRVNKWLPICAAFLP